MAIQGWSGRWVLLACCGAVVLAGCGGTPGPEESAPPAAAARVARNPVLFSGEPGLSHDEQAELRQTFEHMRRSLERRSHDQREERQLKELAAGWESSRARSAPEPAPLPPARAANAETSDEIAPSLIVGGLRQAPSQAEVVKANPPQVETPPSPAAASGPQPAAGLDFPRRPWAGESKPAKLLPRARRAYAVE